MKTCINMTIFILIFLYANPAFCQATKDYNMKADKAVAKGDYNYAFSLYSQGIPNNDLYSVQQIAKLEFKNRFNIEDLATYLDKFEALGKTDGDAAYLAGYIHHYVNREDSIGISYFKRSALRNNMRGMFMLGLCYRDGVGVDNNIDSAIYWVKKSIAANPEHYYFQKHDLFNLLFDKVNMAPNITKNDVNYALDIGAELAKDDDFEIRDLYLYTQILELTNEFPGFTNSEKSQNNLKAFTELMDAYKYYKNEIEIDFSLAKLQDGHHIGIAQNKEAAKNLYARCIDSTEQGSLREQYKVRLYYKASVNLAELYYADSPPNYAKVKMLIDPIILGIWDKDLKYGAFDTYISRLEFEHYAKSLFETILVRRRNKEMGLLSGGVYSQAIRMYGRIDADFQLPDSHYNFAQLYAFNFEDENAKKQFKLAIENTTDKNIIISSSYMLGNGYANAKTGDFDQAYIYYKKGADLGDQKCKEQICLLGTYGYIPKSKSKPYCK